MKKILMISRDMWMLPFSLAYIGDLLKRNSIEYDVAPISSAEDLKNYDLSSYFAVGISAMVMDFEFVKQVSGVVKGHNPATPIVLGGRISVAPERLLAQLPVDYMVLNDANPTMVELLNALFVGLDPGLIKGLLVFRDGNLVHTSAKKMPALEDFSPCWDGVDVQPYLEHLENPAGYPVLTGLGCYGNCHYCAPGYSVHRNRPVDLVLDEMTQAARSYDFESFSFMSEVFYPSAALVSEFCKKYRACGLKMPWLCMLRADFNPELLQTMADAGCVTINLGMESFDDDALASMGKRTTTEQIDRLVSTGQKLGMQVLTNVMLGNAGDSVRSINRTMDYIVSKGTKCIYAIPLITYPGTRMYEMALESGKIADEDEYVGLLCSQDESVSLHGDKYPNMSSMPLEAFRGIYAAANHRLRSNNYSRYSPRTFNIEANETTCPECQQVIGIGSRVGRLAELNINCPHCMNAFPFNPMFTWIASELEQMELPSMPDGKIGMICPQNYALLLGGILSDRSMFGSLDVTLIADTVSDNMVKDLFPWCSLEEASLDQFDAIVSLGLLSPHRMREFLIRQGVDPDQYYCIDSPEYKRFLNYYLEDEEVFFIPNFLAQDIRLFGEDVADVLKEELGGVSIGMAPCGGYARSVAAGMISLELPLACYVDHDGSDKADAIDGVSVWTGNDSRVSDLDLLLVATPSIPAQRDIKATLVRDSGIPAEKVWTLQDLLRKTWLSFS